MAGETLPSGSTNTQGLADWASPYITNYLGKAQALSETPYQVYQGPLTAGASDLQTGAFKGLGSLTVPSSIGQAATTAGNYATQAGGMSYTPQTTDFLGNPNMSGATQQPQTMPAYAVQKPMGMPMQSPADIAFLQQLRQQGPSAGVVGNNGEDGGPLFSSAGLMGSGMPAGLDDSNMGMGGGMMGDAKGGYAGPEMGAYNPAGGMQPQVMPQQGGMPQAGIAGLQPPQASQQPSNIAQQYMNPYLQAALNPQLEEARRQSQITAQQNAAKMTGAGAFGGSRQAILDAENQRNLGTNMSKITGEGYNTAYDKAMQQFNADQARKSQEAQFGATYGLDALRTGIQGAQTQGQLGTQQSQADIANINAKLAGGAQERGITSEGIAADKEEFEKQRQYPYQQAQFQRDMISGLPTGAVTNTAGEMSSVGSLLSALGGGTAAASALGYKDVGELLKGLGLDFGP